MGRARLVLVAALLLAGAAGAFASMALSGSSQAARTVTVTLRNGERGPTGPAGPPGSVTCPHGFQPGVLVVNHPGGQVRLFTCLGPP